MKVAITGGGTAGHVTPLLAVATELRKQNSDSDIRYIGMFGDPMQDIFADDIVNKKYSIFAGKWRRYHGLSFLKHVSDIKTVIKNIRDLFYFIFGFVQSFFILLFWRPNVVFVKGGFVGLPVGLAAAFLRIPIVTHDSDTVPGLTNRMLSRFAKRSAVALPISYYEEYYESSKMVYTGIPLREDYYQHSPDRIKNYRQELGVNLRAKVVTVFGGSLGAVRLNMAILENIDKLLSYDPDLVLFWITGKRQFEQIDENIKNKYNKDRIRTYPFTNEIFKILAISDLVISRAGATSIAELAELSKPTILVPNPFLVGGHQSKNALNLSKIDAVCVISEDQLTEDPNILSKYVIDILSDANKQKELSSALHKLAISDASNRIVSVIREASR